MPAERESKQNLDFEPSKPSERRKRKNSGFTARGTGIRVQGNAPFDPYRFQTFEVTPAFRQRVLEAQLPLLEPRDSFLELPPQSNQRVRAGANDTTLPEMPEGSVAAFADLTTANDKPAPTPLPSPPVVASGAIPKRWLYLGAASMVILGFFGTYLAMRGHTSATTSQTTSHRSLLPAQ